MMYSKRPINDLYGFDFIIARLDFVFGDCVFDSFNPASQGLMTLLGFCWWDLFTTSSMPGLSNHQCTAIAVMVDLRTKNKFDLSQFLHLA